MNGSRSREARVGIFRSPAEFRNFSMDGYAENLAAGLRARCAGFASIEQVRPPVQRASAWLQRGRVSGRLAGHVSRYPRYLLHARTTRFSINHVVDHAYGHLTYALDPRRTVVTCHDIFPLKAWKGGIPGVPRPLLPPVTVLASLSGLRRARFVVTPTQATKHDLVEYLGLPAANIHVVPYGLDPALCPLDLSARADAARRFPLAGGAARYILAVDTAAAYKNQRATIETLARARARSSADIRLVRVGPPLLEIERQRARRHGVEEFIIELGPRPRAEMASIYGRSDLLLFPSFYEGFGWPPLEAMACGVPVVSSRAAAVSEVVADAALQADADDYEALTGHVLTILAGGETSRRLVERGRARAATFTWDRAARDIAELYGSILQERGA